MSSSPSNTFELPTYASGLANLLAEAPSQPPSCIRSFNKLVLDYLDIEAEEGEDSDRHGSPICIVFLLIFINLFVKFPCAFYKPHAIPYSC
jgi:hypothetical protein